MYENKGIIVNKIKLYQIIQWMPIVVIHDSCGKKIVKIHAMKFNQFMLTLSCK